MALATPRLTNPPADAPRVAVDAARLAVQPDLTPWKLAETIPALDRNRLVAAHLDGEIIDLHRALPHAGTVGFLDETAPEALEVLRHSGAHVMAEAVQQLFPGALVTIGPVIEGGFFYDFDFERPFTPEDLERIDAAVMEIVRRGDRIVRSEMPVDSAIAMFGAMGETYKVELIEELKARGETAVSIYTQGAWKDLCRGPHLPSTRAIKAFKTLSVAGAYWRGSERNKMLQRIYATAFFSREALKRHLADLEEARKRDHRRLGKDLDLFSVDEEVGAGLILWHPRGARVRSLIEEFWRQEHFRAGYELVYSPHMAHSSLWKTSGHWDFYRESMFSPMQVEDQEYLCKPMNCPFHIKIFQSARKSYRELPLRLAELGTVYRYEKSGVLHGLTRVRGFTQDDAHLFCTREQMGPEIERVLQFVLKMLRTFGFERFEIFLSTRPEKAVGEAAIWEEATGALRSAIDSVGLPYAVDEGGGAFYGPKVDVKLKDALGRSWQCSTVQLDFNLPERFGIEYIGSDNRPHRPIMIHRALLGSMERFFGCLVEHYAGAFPLWLAPVQAVMVPITDRHVPYARRAADRMAEAGLRVEVDARPEKMNAKIRDAQLMKVPYMLVVGDKEEEQGAVAPRRRDGTSQSPRSVESFIQQARREIEERH